MSDSIRWGILGTGAIAKKFATALQSLAEAKLVAIGSRSQSKADEFGTRFNVPRRHANYEALVEDTEVDAVYVATPHSCHKDNAFSALSAGKPVLVEKPFTINAVEAQSIIQLGRAKKLLVMEAMWTRFLPLFVHLRQMLAEGRLGQVRLIMADFGFKAAPQTHPRLFDPALGGGALLDIGVYPVSFTSSVFGAPSRVTGAAELGPTRVDEQSGMLLAYPEGRLAVLCCGIRANMSLEINLVGDAGRARIHAPGWKSTALTLTDEAGREDLLKFPFEGNGYQFEAIEFMNCLRAGKLESEIMPLDETLSIMKTLDALRAQWGLRYPMEET